MFRLDWKFFFIIFETKKTYIETNNNITKGTYLYVICSVRCPSFHDICFLTKANIAGHKHVHRELVLVEGNGLVFQ